MMAIRVQRAKSANLSKDHVALAMVGGIEYLTMTNSSTTLSEGIK